MIVNNDVRKCVLMKESIELLKSLTDVNGIAGYERNVKAKMKEYLEPVSDEIIEDGLGGIFGKKASDNGTKSLMVAGHLDEIGFIVTKIDNNGFIKFQTIIGSKPPHVLDPEERKKPVQIKDMFIDIGVRSKEDAENHGIEVGNMITPYSEFEELANGKYLTAKAFDNRYGCALAIDVLKRLKDEQIGVDLYAGATVQEEVGLRGAKVAANKIKPDLAIAVDVAVAYDTPGMNNLGSETTLGNGPVVILMDASNVAHQGLRQHIKEVARRHYITVQWDTTAGGGTDAGSIHVANEGIPTISIGVALRYMHSNVSVLHTDDYENSVRLVTEIVRSLNDDAYERIKW